MKKEKRDEMWDLIKSYYPNNDLDFALEVDQKLNEIIAQENQKSVEEKLPKKDNFNNKLEKNKAYSPAELGTFLGRVGYKEGWNACLETLKQRIKNAQIHN